MRRALVALALALLLVAALLSPLLRPIWVERTGLRARISAGASRALKRPVAIARLDVGLLPPRLLLEDVSIGAGHGDATPGFAARALSLRASGPGLLAGRFDVEHVELDDVRLRASGPPAIDLSLRRLALEAEPVRVERGAPADGPLPVRFEAHFEDAGRVAGRGTLDAAGAVSLEATLDRVALAPFAGWLHLAADEDARVEGTLRVEGSLVAPQRIAAALRLRSGAVSLRDLRLHGDVRATIEAADDWLAPTGSLAIDATAGELERGELLRKQPGAPARFEARLGLREDGRHGLVEPRLHLERVQMRALPGGSGGVRIELGGP